MEYNSGPPKYERRKFLKNSGYVLLGSLVFGVSSLSADGITRDSELLEIFNKAREMIRKGRGKEFEYEITGIDLDGDGRNNDSLAAEFVSRGTMRNEKDVFDDGPKLTLIFNVSGTESKLWGLFKGGKCEYVNIFWGNEDKMKKYLGVVLEHLEKED